MSHPDPDAVLQRPALLTRRATPRAGPPAGGDGGSGRRGSVAFERHGARIQVWATNPAAEADVVAALPDGAVLVDDDHPADQTFTVVSGPARRGRPTWRVSSGGLLLAAGESRAELVHELSSRLDFAIAEHATERVYVHAGVVAVGGRAAVLPGRSLSGKTTLVTALVRAGATFYSDEFAVVDEAGRVWPHARPLSVRTPGTTGPGRPTTIEELGARRGVGPIPVAAVISTRHVTGATWPAVELDRGDGLLSLLDNAVVARTKPQLALSVLARAVTTARVFDGVRGDADETARRVLELVRVSWTPPPAGPGSARSRRPASPAW